MSHQSSWYNFYTNHLGCAATIWHFKQDSLISHTFELFNINILHKLHVIFKRLPGCFIFTVEWRLDDTNMLCLLNGNIKDYTSKMKNYYL